MGASAFLYGLVCYAVFLVVFLYSIGFVGGFIVPKTLDSPPYGPVPEALITDAVLLGLFAVQHSVMARPGFKRWWTKVVPPSIERSTYVLIASLLLALLFWKWQPLRGEVWRFNDGAGYVILTALFWIGWVVVLVSTFLINHFDLFGLRQVWLRLRGMPYTPVQFKTLLFYKFVRHPIMLGFLIAFWSSPYMSGGHFVFAMASTAYIFIGVFFEERDLAAAHGEQFAKYRDKVPMIVPIPGRSAD